MEQGAINDTLRQIKRLSEAAHPPIPSQAALLHAQEFVAQAAAALVAEGNSEWLTPDVEIGEGGVVVLLWQDGQRDLSLLLGPEGPVTSLGELKAPGFSHGDENSPRPQDEIFLPVGYNKL